MTTEALTYDCGTLNFLEIYKNYQEVENEPNKITKGIYRFIGSAALELFSLIGVIFNIVKGICSLNEKSPENTRQVKKHCMYALLDLSHIFPIVSFLPTFSYIFLPNVYERNISAIKTYIENS